MPDLEIWGGVECTVVRLGDRFRNQVVETGHHDRLTDLDRIAALGVRTLRYPILWETIAPDDPDSCDWCWHDARLARLKTLGIRVIAGLLHHGSGPRYTSLMDPAFPRLLAAHAARVARRYPWIELFTPVNEPLTTARLSCLYGTWYPHARDDHSFLRALLNQCEATVLAMQAIREVTPSAQLVQTEDVCKVFSTPRLRYQADFENARRWLSLDLLCGTVDRHHTLYGFLRDNGVGAVELESLRENRCPPDIIGANYYLTSERFLHSRTAAFPAAFAGGNGRDRYADVEAVRMPLPPTQLGPAARLAEVWARYRRPMAVTEVHHGCTREEQLRWLMEVWNAAAELRRSGADMRAVTVWSMFGAVDWNSLLTRHDGCYETGAFDVRNDPPRLTALGRAVKCLAQTKHFDHPVVMDSPGWWHRPERFYRAPTTQQSSKPAWDGRRPILLVGGESPWLRTCRTAAQARGLAMAAVTWNKGSADNAARLSSVLQTLRPWAVIASETCSGETIDNTRLRELGHFCVRLNIQLALISNDPCRRHDHFEEETQPDKHSLARSRPGAARPHDAWTDTILDVCAGLEYIDAALDLLIDREHGLWLPSSRGLQRQRDPKGKDGGRSLAAE